VGSGGGQVMFRLTGRVTYSTRGKSLSAVAGPTDTATRREYTINYITSFSSSETHYTTTLGFVPYIKTIIFEEKNENIFTAYLSRHYHCLSITLAPPVHPYTSDLYYASYNCLY